MVGGCCSEEQVKTELNIVHCLQILKVLPISEGSVIPYYLEVALAVVVTCGDGRSKEEGKDQESIQSSTKPA